MTQNFQILSKLLNCVLEQSSKTLRIQKYSASNKVKFTMSGICKKKKKSSKMQRNRKHNPKWGEKSIKKYCSWSALVDQLVKHLS